MERERLLRVSVVARRLGLKERQVRNLIYQGKLPAVYRSERNLRVAESAVVAYQESLNSPQ